MSKNIIFLMTDQHRLDYVGFSKSGKLETPNIDRIAESVGFTNCQSVNPLCTPARTSLITGKYSHQVGTLAMSGDLSHQHPTFMQALQKKGYYTSGIGKFHYLQPWEWSTPRGNGVDLVSIKDEMKNYGYDYVWETSGKQLALRNYCDYMEYLNNKGLVKAYRDFVESAGPNHSTPDYNTDQAKPWPFEEKDYIDIVTADKILEQIKERPKDRPFYLFGSFCCPHKPYDPPKRYLDMVAYEEVDDFILAENQFLSEEMKSTLYRQRRASKAMVKLIDEQIGRIFDLLDSEGLLKNTVILFTSDHGDMLGDHYRIEKAVPWKESVTVPLAIRHPQYLNGEINTSSVSLIDITATILDIAEIDPKEALSKEWPAFHNIVPCKSLLPIIEGKQKAIREYTFSECSGDWQMIQSDKWKYIRYLRYDKSGEPIEEFYDLAEDPDERINLINNPKHAHAITWCKARREYILDHTPPAQTTWSQIVSTKK